MSRRRLALVLAALILAFNAYMDYQLLLRNPDEQEAQLRRVLQFFLPNYTPEIQRTEVEFLSGKLVLHDVVLHEEGDPSRKLIRIPRLEVEGNGFPVLESLSLTAIDPEIAVRVGSDGSLNLNFGDGSREPAGAPLVELNIAIRRGRLRLINRLEGMAADEGDLLIDGISADLRLETDKSMRASGSFDVAALFPPGHRLAGENRRVPGIPDRRSKEIAPNTSFDVVSAPGGDVRAVIEGRVEISDAIRSLLPPTLQNAVWKNIGPAGGSVDARVRVASEKDGVHVAVSLVPRGAVIKAAGFPVPIADIEGGQFEITVVVPNDGPLKFLGVAWEGIRARVERRGASPTDSRGHLLSRGTVFPGADDEGVSMLFYVDVERLPLSEQLVDAFPPSIREVYKRFDPQGVIQKAYVVLAKGPFERDVVTLRTGRKIHGVLLPSGPEEIVYLRDEQDRVVGFNRDEIEDVDRYDAPEISVWIPQLAGSLNAMYVDIPVRLSNAQGWFRLSEGANVELEVEGDLDVGGRARVEARVMHGDLISVDVWGHEIPVGDGKRIVSCLPGDSPEMVAPFNLHGGFVDFHTKVEKPSPEAPVQPKISVDFHGVSFSHDEVFPKELTAEGTMRVIPWFNSEDSLEEIELGLDLELQGEGVVGAVVSGSLFLPPEQPKELTFRSDLRIAAERVDVGGLPDTLSFMTPLAGTGVATKISARVLGPSDLEISGRGDGLSTKLTTFPYRVGVDSFDVEVRGSRVSLRNVQGTTNAGGLYSVSGSVSLPKSEQDEVDLDLRLIADSIQFEESLVSAMPAAIADELGKLHPTGAFSTTKDLHMVFSPGEPPRVVGTLVLEDASCTLEDVHPDLRSLGDTPATDLVGEVRLTPGKAELVGLRGSFLDSPVSISGLLEFGVEAPPFDLQVELDRLTVNERARKLAGPTAEGFFKSFEVEGPVGFAFRVYRRAQGETVHVDMDARPKGATIVPVVLLELPITDVHGSVFLADGEPIRVDINGFLEPPLEPGQKPPVPRATIQVRRDQAREWRFPGRGSRGQVYYVSVDGFRRFEDPRRRAAFERRLPDSWLSNLTKLNPTGSMNIQAWVYQPTEVSEREPIRWVAEAELQNFGFTAGMPFDGINGLARARGRLSEFEKGSGNGELLLKTFDWEKQTFSNVKAKFDIADGLLSMGRPGAPFTARLYPKSKREGGEFKGVMTYDFLTGAYRGWLGLVDGSMAEMMRELDEWNDSRTPNRRTLGAQLELARAAKDRARTVRLERELQAVNARIKNVEGRLSAARARDEEERVEALGEELAKLKGERREARVPYRGNLHAVIEYAGGGVDVNGKPIELHGDGSLVLEKANLFDVSFFQVFKNVVNAFQGQVTTTNAIENMELSFKLKPDRFNIKRLRLSGQQVAVLAKGGYIAFNGRLEMRLVPFDTDSLFEILSFIPGTGYKVTGYLWDWKMSTVPAILSPAWIRKQLLPGDVEDD